MDNKLEFSTQAFGKMFMHVMKYPHSICSGFLLSPRPDDHQAEAAGDSSTNNDNNGSRVEGNYDDVITIIEAIPISHASHCLAPNIEIAFNSVTTYAKEQGLNISGYYQTGGVDEVTKPDVFSQRITEKICESYPKAVLCETYFDKTTSQPTLELYQLSDGKWTRKSPTTYSIETEPQVIADNILFTKEKLYRKMNDFDDHFNNIKLDWTNAAISQKIDILIADVC